MRRSAAALRRLRVGCADAERRMSNSSAGPREEVVIALGSNQGDRAALLRAAARALKPAGVDVSVFSSLYETAPAYVTDQPPFLNAAVRGTTQLPPHELLRQLKAIEAELGRTVGGQRFGPRPIDLDIIFYGRQRIETPTLQVPHPRLRERLFVLAPLADLASRAGEGSLQGDGGPLRDAAQLWQQRGGEALVGSADLLRVLPLPDGGMWRLGQRTRVMGVLNVTPDSFSDGGSHNGSCSAAVDAALRMVADGADIVDIGGQSTRPGAMRVAEEEEARRIIPVIAALRGRLGSALLSVDTFYASVARAAAAEGAHIVNDVSGGRLDSGLFAAVGDTSALYVLMHSRGDPATMQEPRFTAYDDVCAEVGAELLATGAQAQAAGIEPWRMLVDPGLGFAKTQESNLALLRRLPDVRAALDAPGALRRAPMLLGPSRKGFLGRITGKAAAERDWATAAAITASVAGGTEAVRVHNVAALRDAVLVADAIYR